jgi:hypothetical protein
MVGSVAAAAEQARGFARLACCRGARSQVICRGAGEKALRETMSLDYHLVTFD